MNLMKKSEPGWNIPGSYCFKSTLMILTLCVSTVFSVSVKASSAEAGQQRVAVVENSGMAMHKKMLDIEKRVKALQVQMQGIRSNAKPDERYRLLLQHIRSTRQTLDLLRGMEISMDNSQPPDAKAPDAQLKRRQAIVEQLMDMMLLMLEQVALFQEPALKK